MDIGRILVLALAAAGLFTTTAARAQKTEGAFQLGLSTSVLSYSTGTLEVESETLGLEADADISTTSWGIGEDSPVTLELGYGVTDMLVIGGFLRLGGTSQETDYDQAEFPDSESSEFSMLLGPKLDVMFSPGNTVRPFVGAGVGLLIQSSEDADENETSLTGFQLVGRAGLRAFLADGFSLDPALDIGWGTASGEAESAVGDLDLSASVFNVGVSLGLSGWIL
jgi:outer membrane protein W